MTVAEMKQLCHEARLDIAGKIMRGEQDGKTFNGVFVRLMIESLKREAAIERALHADNR